MAETRLVDAVRLDFYRDLEGPFALRATSRPEDIVERDFPFRSADWRVQRLPSTAAWQGDGLLFRPAVASPLGLSPLAAAGSLRLFFMYRPLDREEMLRFDARITEEYTAFYAAHGMDYCGTFDVEGPGGAYIGEICVFDAASPEEAGTLGNDARTQSIIDIEEECRLLQDSDAPRYAFWLLPKGCASEPGHGRAMT